ncbi:peptidase domain-containing ABC transporter [uncultured Fibrella sp.]|uniref:peptidase domain-containing ABC transporter n=1 Tax=uncultured Fibrella sp. TaxID=1284596 RepID=UPI0035CA8EE7
MNKFPFYHQLDQMDCGSTCLRMIAKYYGRIFTAQSLRDKTQINKDGASLLGVAEAAESIGLRSLGVKISFEKLCKEAPLPCIVHWGQNHFVVVHAIKNADNQNKMRTFFSKVWKMGKAFFGYAHLPSSVQILNVDVNGGSDSYLNRSKLIIDETTAELNKNMVYVADPGKGFVTYTGEEFCSQWIASRNRGQPEGVALLLEPTPAFFEQDDEHSPNYSFERVLHYLWQYKRLLAQLILGLAVSSVLQLVFPLLTQSVVDIGINTQNISFIYLVLVAQLMLMAGRLLVELVQGWLLLYVSTRVNLNILSDFLVKLMRLPLSYFDTKRFGDIMQRIGDHRRVETFVTSQALPIPFALVNMIGLSLVVAFYNLSIFGIYMAGSLLYAGWIVIFLKRRRQLDMKRFDLSAKNQSVLVELIQGMQEIKLAGAERHNRWMWERLQAKLFRLQIKSLSLGQFQQVGGFLINDGKNILITFLAAQTVINGQLTLGAMLALQQIIGQLNGPVSQLINFSQSFQDAKISLERLNEIHTLTDEEPLSSILIEQLPSVHSLTLKDVAFTYPGAGNEPVLRNINLSILAGKTTAIVGMSGSGKTTLLKLLLRFYEPNEGEIRSGGTALKNIRHSFWRSQCGVVMQDGFLFSDTIARNIAVGVEQIDKAKLDHAVCVANLQIFVESLPSGLHTKIGAEGNGISQGQRQRILIARAVYKNPQYIFFDEATNALDATNEAVIMKNLGDFFTGRTVVIVAHRLSTVCNADQIVVLDKSQLAELGTHAELIALRGSYWQLVKNQLELGV